MQKKLMVVAVAGALAAPAVAFAQLNVTFSGYLKVGVESLKISNPRPELPPAGRGGLHDSEVRVTDNTSRLIVNANDDLGGGMQAIGQIDFRPVPDTGALTANGNTWVGVRSKEAGTLLYGRSDMHYNKNPSEISTKAGALKAGPLSLVDYINGTRIFATGSRVANVVRWDSPNWSGFTLTAGYSTNADVAEADLNSGQRKGKAVTVNPGFTASNFKVEYSAWRSKPDAPVAADRDKRADTINAWFSQAGLKVGVAYNKAEQESSLTKVATDERTAWTIPVSYSTGPHDLHFHYTKAGENKKAAVTSGTDAKMMAFAYVYNVSKRTSLGVTYAAITNGELASYAFHTDDGGGQSSTNAAPLAGEDPRLLAFIIRHAL